VSGASNDNRSPMADAMRWVHQITSIAAEMALPPLVGFWLDERWRTGPWLVAVGALLGFIAAMVHLLALAKQAERRQGERHQGQRPRGENPPTGRQTRDQGGETDRGGK
jgi:ATP synthase protein I